MMESWRESQYTCGWYLLWRVSSLCHQARRGGSKVALSIVSIRLEDNLSPSDFLFLLLELWELLLKNLHLSSWMLWGLV